MARASAPPPLAPTNDHRGAPRFVGQAHGKVILLGEHAVVYGHPALCAALQDGVTVTAVSGCGALVVPQWDVRTAPAAVLLQGGEAAAGELAADQPLCRAYRAVLAELLPSPAPQVIQGLRQDFVARFDIPQSAGLGSSAALSVALVRALSHALHLELPPERIAAGALAAERVFHGKPSGLDHTVAQLGGFGVFRRGAGLRGLPAQSLRLCIGHTGRQRDTKARVARVAELALEQPAWAHGVLAEIAELVERGAQAVCDGEWRGLGAAMQRNQELLRLLDVSCPEIDRVCGLALAAGALGAKLTGGGGGGCVIALAAQDDPGPEAAVLAAWREAGFHGFVATVGGGQERRP